MGADYSKTPMPRIAEFGTIRRRMDGFAKNALLLFVALRVGDFVNVAAGMWFVPRYVSPEDIGAVLPVTSFATFRSLPMFAFAMTVMKESACLSTVGARGKVKSLLKGVFVAVAAILVLVLSVSAVAVPHFLTAMRCARLYGCATVAQAVPCVGGG